jgi:hypothetical protein
MKQTTIRPQKVIKAIALLAVPTILVTGLLTWAYHPVRVWLADGEWCANFASDGHLEGYEYGKACRNR